MSRIKLLSPLRTRRRPVKKKKFLNLTTRWHDVLTIKQIVSVFVGEYTPQDTSRLEINRSVKKNGVRDEKKKRRVLFFARFIIPPRRGESSDGIDE